VHNSGGYDAVETLRLLTSVVDIYTPDMKRGDQTTAERPSGAGTASKSPRRAFARSAGRTAT
jgi:putative pyruvate formate lyase activating enzyme